MARTNRTKYAVLGVLSTGPQSGYDVKKFCEEALGFFWRESYGQIYPLLGSLEKDGLIRKEKRISREAEKRIPYTLTNDGSKDLAEWLASPSEEQPPRNELLLKVFFSNLTGPATLMPQIEAHEEAQRELRKVLQGVLDNLEKENKNDPQLAYWKITVRLGLRICEARMEWARETMAELELLRKRNPKHDHKAITPRGS